MTKALVIACISILCSFSYAGEFSKIDLIVRETISYELDVEFSSSTNLSIEESVDGCLIVVSALTEIDGNKHKVFTCVNRKPNSSYKAQILELIKL